MIFEVDRRTVTEGDVVEVTWQCEKADSVSLTLDNGFRKTDIPLEKSGNKRFRLNRSKGRTKLTIAATVAGKTYRKTLAVQVKKMPTMRAETVDQQGRRQSSLKIWWQQLLTNWHNLRGKWRMRLQGLPEQKQLAVKVLAVIGLMLLVSAIFPRLYGLVPLAVIAYLTVILLRR